MLKSLPRKFEIEKCNHGISSYYYPVNGKIGIKWFKKRGERDYSKTNQHLAYLAGFAPQTFENVYSDGFWGYVTEEVEMLHNKFKNLPNKYFRMIEQLSVDIYNSCDFTVDENYKNFGLKNGKLVLVDFGYCAYDNYNYCVR